MRVVIYGAGAVGGAIGARLHLSGADVVLIARGAHLAALREQGLRFVAPDDVHTLSIPVVGHPAEIGWTTEDAVLLTMKSQHTVAALDALAECAPPGLAVICAQNGVANERMALRRFVNVYGMVVNLPALHLTPGEVVTHAAGSGGILDVGRYPGGSDALAEALAEALSRAGFSAVPDSRIMRKKYAKLLMNLGNALQAATSPADGGHRETEHAALERIGRRLRSEALRCFEAAGIDCASREEVRARHENTYRMVDIEGWPRPGGSSWQSVRRGTGNIETDFLNGEIVLLGGLHGVPTPANRVCQLLARRMVAEALDVGAFEPQTVLEMVEREIAENA